MTECIGCLELESKLKQEQGRVIAIKIDKIKEVIRLEKIIYDLKNVKEIANASK